MKTKQCVSTTAPVLDMSHLTGLMDVVREKVGTNTKINELMAALNQEREKSRELSRKITVAFNGATKALKTQGFSPERASTIARGAEGGLTPEQLKFIASDKFDDAQALAIMKALDPANVRFDGSHVIQPERVMEIANMGLSAAQLTFIYDSYIYGYIYGDPENEIPIYCHKEYSIEKLNIMWDAVHNSKYGKRSINLADKYAKMPFTDRQLVQVLDNPDHKEYITYMGCKNVEIHSLPLSDEAHESVSVEKWLASGTDRSLTEYVGRESGKWTPLTEEQISVYADPELPPELMCILRLALHAGVPVEQVSKYTIPRINIEQLHDKFVEYILEEKRKATT